MGALGHIWQLIIGILIVSTPLIATALGHIWQLIIGILIVSAPLIATALGGMYSEKSGIVNIGLEGIMTFGAFLTAVGIITLEAYNLPSFIILTVGLFCGIIGGVIFAYLHALLTIRWNVDQIISGTAINIVGLALALFLTEVLYGQSATPYKESFSIKILGVPLLVIFVLLLVPFSYYILHKTKFGLRLKACGENPKAASSVGINVVSIRTKAVLLSGVFGAIGGACLVILVSGGFSSTTVSGKGFIALAVLIFGQWEPIGILFAGLLFGFLTKFGTTITVLSTGEGRFPVVILVIVLIFLIFIMYKSKNKIINILIMLLIYLVTLSIIYNQGSIPSDYYDILPYIMTIVALVYYSKEKVEPSALGKPFSVDGR